MRAKHRNGGSTSTANDDLKERRSRRGLVYVLLARLRETDRASFADTDRLVDLEIDALDLVLMALKLEEIEPDRGPFPLFALARVATVGELVEVVDRWWRGETGSGTRRTSFM